MQIIYQDSSFPESVEKTVLVKANSEKDLQIVYRSLALMGFDGTILTTLYRENESQESVRKDKKLDFERIADAIVDLYQNDSSDIDKVMALTSIKRTGGEVYVPAYIWETAQFQSWYKDLIKSGNRLEKADVLYHFTTPSGFVFSYMMHVSIWVESEKRFKANEIIVSRRNVSNVIAYTDDKIVLIKEFRSPVSNDEGFIYELPGGSSFDDALDPLENARTEFFEEAGFYIEDKSRFRHVSDRQLAATVVTHKANLYAIKLTDDEIEKIEEIGKEKHENTTTIGDNHEHTYTIVIKKEDLFKLPVDFSTVGMIYSALK